MAEATPQPLRIIKCSSKTVSDFSYLSNSATSARLDSGPFAQAPPCNALHVPKQRRTGTRRLSSVLGSSSRSTSSHFTTTSSPSNSMGKPPASDNNGQYLVVPSATRAFTTGAIDTGRFDSHQSPTLRPSRTQPSLRQRLLSRVTSGSSARIHVSHAAMERDAVIRRLHGEGIGEVGPVKDAPLETPRPSTASSMETISTLGADLELALAAFPTPPKSAVTSPTTVSSFETSRTEPRPLRRLVQPSNVVIASATLRLFPELDHLSLERDRSMFVAVGMCFQSFHFPSKSLYESGYIPNG